MQAADSSVSVFELFINSSPNLTSDYESEKQTPTDGTHLVEGGGGGV